MKIHWENDFEHSLEAGLIGLMHQFDPCDIKLLETLTWAHRIRQHGGFQEITGLTKSPCRVVNRLQRAKAHQITGSALRWMDIYDEQEQRTVMLEVCEGVHSALNEVIATGLSVMFNAAKDCPTSFHFDSFFELVDVLISLIKDPNVAKDARSRFTALRALLVKE
ncbi:MAG: hypothetical protein HY918_04365 [Candidatus Doudnabacteria bacterium]|nr:hypothetical protein [Candidatus Doudnabacteria bacterium]